jgi:hypothetical protein
MRAMPWGQAVGAPVSAGGGDGATWGAAGRGGAEGGSTAVVADSPQETAESNRESRTPRHHRPGIEVIALHRHRAPQRDHGHADRGS